jgi:pimeloyl-ACP methyl ester carboxylesterase
MAALGHDRATVVGQSFGGGVAMQLAYQFPARCERLVLVSSGGLGSEVSALLRTLSLPGAEHVLGVLCSDALRDGAERIIAWLGRAGMQPAPVLEEVRRAWGSLADARARRAFFRTLRAVIDRSGQTVCANDRLYLTAHLPTMIVWGAEDSLIPVAHARAAHAAMPGSRLEIFESSGHFPHCDAPERFADTIVDFVGRTQPARLTESEMSVVLEAQASCSMSGTDAQCAHG